MANKQPRVEKLNEDNGKDAGVKNSGAQSPASDVNYRKMIAEVQDYAIILLNKEGIIQNWNKGAQQIKQYTAEEIVGKSFKIFYLPEDLATNLPERLLNEAATKGRAVHEGWRVRKDGTRFWGSITLTALHDDDENIIGYSKMTRDLTDKKVAEEAINKKNEELRKSEDRYHKMIAEVQDYAIILLDEQGRIQNWNTGAEKIKGYTAEEITGKSFRIFYPPEDQKSGLPERLLAEATKNGKATHEGWRVRKNGSKFWGSIVITALHASDGKIIGYSKVTRDLTERKMAEDRLAKYLDELEQQNKELEQFAYVTSHDLQEPLRKIQTFSEIIQTRINDKAVVEKYLEKITVASRRMSELISSVLEYSRLTSTATSMVDTDLNTVLAGVKNDFELLIAEKKAIIEHSPLPVVRAIPMQMNQLFTNLIGNALKFSLQEPVIKITARVVGANEIINPPSNYIDGKYMEIAFSDNGIGFDQQYDKVIFAIFQRLHGKNEFAGTGIGLAICKKIMETHGGFISAKSDPSKGATFFTYFPMKAVTKQ